MPVSNLEKIGRPASLIVGLLLLLAACPGGIKAANYYFSSAGGDDTRSFSEAQKPATPWKTISHFNRIVNRLSPGDSILFKRGEKFDGGLVINTSGTVEAPIVIGAYGTGAKPVISGLWEVSDWHSIGNSIFESGPLPAGEKVNMVVINDRNYAMGRFPNSKEGYFAFESSGAGSITDQELSSAIDWTGAEIVLRSTRFTFESVPVEKHSGNTVYFGAPVVYPLQNGYGYFFQDHINTLDQTGEWYYDPDTKKIAVCFDNESPAAFDVKIAVVDVLVNALGDHILLENLNLEGANQYAVFSKQKTADDLQVRDCRIRFSGIDGVFLQGRANFRMERCTILNSNSSAVKPLYNNANTVLRNNYIRNTGIQPGMGSNDDQSYSAIYKGTGGLIAEYNTIVNTGYMGIRFAMDDNLIKNNVIDSFCLTLDDGGGIYAFGGTDNPTSQNRKVVGNIILNGMGTPGGTAEPKMVLAKGIYIDDNGNNVEITDNTIAHCSRGINIHNARDIILEGNTVFNNDIQLALHHDHLAGPVTGMEVSQNIFFSRERSQTVSSLRSTTDDFESFGNFHGNYYVRPLDDLLPILAEYYDQQGNLHRKYYELEEWKTKYGQEDESKKSPVRIPSYSLQGVPGTNLFSNSTFDKNLNGLFCWAGEGNGKASWEISEVMEGGAVSAAGSNKLFLIAKIDPVADGKQYLLRFSAAAEKRLNLEVYLRREDPYEVISQKQVINIGTTKTSYEVLFSHPASESNPRVEFLAAGKHIQLWLDDLEVFEVQVTRPRLDEHFYLAYNPTQKNKTIPLEADYVDVKNKRYSGEVVLSPFESLILIKI